MINNDVVNLRYSTPEIFLGSTKYGTQSDIWSIRSIFGELLSGNPLFFGANPLNIIGKI